jgi:hypothetical protein
MRIKDIITEQWTKKYKSSINCSHPKGFSQKAHCAGKKKHNESIEMEIVCEDCGMCETHGEHLRHSLDEACWKGHHKEGMKTMFGKRYPNCIKNKNESLETYINKGECPGCGGVMVAEGGLNEKQDACYHKVKSRYKVWPSAYASGALVQCRKKGAANWGSKSNESITQQEYDQLDENLKKWFSDKWVRFGPDGKIRGDCARGDDSEGKPKCLPQSKAQSLGKKGRASAAARKRREDPNPERSGSAINVSTKKKSNEGVAEELGEEFDLIETIIENLAKNNGVDAEAIWEDLESLSDDELYVFATTTTITESEAWQKANKKDKTDGMSQKAVNSYRRAHPGSKLKTAVTTKPSKLKKGSKASKRRKSYCSRSRGQMKMHSISCAKTPDKAICKARRRWNC